MSECGIPKHANFPGTHPRYGSVFLLMVPLLAWLYRETKRETRYVGGSPKNTHAHMVPHIPKTAGFFSWLPFARIPTGVPSGSKKKHLRARSEISGAQWEPPEPKASSWGANEIGLEHYVETFIQRCTLLGWQDFNLLRTNGFPLNHQKSIF